MLVSDQHTQRSVRTTLENSFRMIRRVQSFWRLYPSWVTTHGFPFLHWPDARVRAAGIAVGFLLTISPGWDLLRAKELLCRKN
jgi:hypothetical protein